ncbi:MAG: hypothetical protein JWO30_4960 [Fibrobacteres bacterium]|nr:hypothetical protein [Fibrobacterota bacterium]
MLRIATLLLGLGLWACNNPVPLEPSLSSRTGTAPTGSNCAGCHAYPVGGVNHQFHLMHADSLKTGNGPITCLDCHCKTLVERDQTIFDSIYAIGGGKSVSAYDSASSAGFRSAVGSGQYNLIRVDTLVHHRPVPLPGPADRVTFLQEWMTGVDHLNGIMDVKFDPANSDPARYNSKTAVFDPVMETCSAVACHVHSTPYRWPAPSKGLTGLNVNASLK